MMTELVIVYRNPAELRDDPRNARTHSSEQIEQIRASIREFGFTNPVLLREDGTIGAGHGRKAAAVLEELEAIPTITLTGLTDAQWRAYAIADNKLALNAGWDNDLLKGELLAIRELGIDWELTGFGREETDALFPPPPQAPDDFPSFDENIATEHCCPRCSYRWSGPADAGAKQEAAADA